MKAGNNIGGCHWVIGEIYYNGWIWVGDWGNIMDGYGWVSEEI